MIWMKGFSYLLGLKGGLVADMIVPIAMISLGVDFGVHAIRRYQEEKSNNITFDKKFIMAFTGVGAALTLAFISCLLYTSPSPRDKRQDRMPSSA